MNSRILYALLLAAVPPAGAEAATRTWPGGPGCTGTLQACVDAATAGDRIEIATATPIDETLVLPARSLTLTAADGFKPAFVGVGVVIEDVGASGDITVSISRLMSSSHGLPGMALIIDSTPAATRRCTGAGSFSSRIVFEICGRERLMRWASSSWVQPKSSSICW